VGQTGRGRRGGGRTDGVEDASGPAEAGPSATTTVSGGGLGNDRGRTLGRDRSTRCWRKVLPKRGRSSRPDDKEPRTDRGRRAVPGRHAWALVRVGTHQLPERRGRGRSPEGDLGRRHLADASPDGRPEGEPAVQDPRRYPFPAETGIGRPRRVEHGKGRSLTRGAVRAQSPWDGVHPRVLVCVSPVRQPDPRSRGT
jgi:hypothetical protein